MGGVPGPGSVVSAIGDVFSGYSEGESARYKAAIAGQNAAIAAENARAMAGAGEAAMFQSQMKTRAQIGQTKVAQAASGLDINTGSPVQVRQSEAEIGQLDAMTIRSNAARQAYGYDVKAAQERAQQKLYKQEATQAEVAGYINAASSLLGGASSAGNQRALTKESTGTDPGAAVQWSALF